MTKIVILDDRGTNRRILTQLALSTEPSAEVTAFADPIQTLEWLKRQEADIILTDYRMPKLNGAEFISAVRVMELNAEVPIVVVTAYGDPDLRLHALEAGATDFLLAPVEHLEFRCRIRNLLALRRHQVRLRQEAQDLARDLALSERSRRAVIRESRQALARLIDTVPALISATDRDGRLLFVNAHQAARAGCNTSDLIGEPAARILGEARALRCAVLDQEVFSASAALPPFEEDVVLEGGAVQTLLTTKAPLMDGEGHVAAVLSTSVDISDRKRAEDRLLFLARHDPLTNLPNRTLLAEELQRACDQDSSAEGRRFTLFLLDLDHFKMVNDVLGHHAGDLLLQEVAARLSSVSGRNGLVSRLSGDEFAVMHDGVGSEEAACALAERLLEELAKPFTLLGRRLSISASIGIALFAADGRGAEELLRDADLAMYKAKSKGRRSFCLFEPALDEAAQEAMRLASDLQEALPRDEFELRWQPQLDLATGRIVGAEALLRWRHPERGLLSPDAFLDLAASSGLMDRITEWVLRSACRQGACWAAAHDPGFRVAVNISPSLFRATDVRRLMASALAESGLSPGNLDIELTEREQFDDLEGIAAKLLELRELGICLSIDDFGIGYSSLMHAKHLPVQRVKIDKSFIANFLSDQADAAIVSAVIALTRQLGMASVAEGVETSAQVAALRELGCDEIQGYILSPPVPGKMLDAMLGEDASAWVPAR
jgi:diguanylate cyclase (GGDEF)-like protein/PAS domain S-box-containing protein